MKFDCDRTCPLFERVDACRFNPILRAIGQPFTASHTVKVRVELRDPDALRAAVEAMGGTWLGEGKHDLFSGQRATGFGFRLPKWNFPLVLDKTGELHFDDYQGRWGDKTDIERLKGEYVLACAFNSAVSQGWQVERSEAGLHIQHPSGGTLTVTTGGVIDANGFAGVGCHDAIMALGMNTEWAQAKPQFGQLEAEVQQGAG